MLRVTLLHFSVALVVLISSVGAAENVSVDRDLNKYPIRFAIIGDRTGEAQVGIYEQILGEAERLRPEFVMTVGDQIEGYTSDTVQLGREWREYLDIVKTLSCPLYLTPGNHDITYDDMEDTYRHHTGRSPYYSFDYDGLHVVVFDNSRWYNSDEMPSEQIQWLADDLAGSQDARHTLVFCHVPFWYRTLADNRPDTLHSIFRTYGVDAVFCGHFHAYFTGEFDNVKYTTVGTSGGDVDFRPGAPGYHFAWVTVSEDDIEIAPIGTKSVMSWDTVTVEDERYYHTSRLRGIDFANAASVGESSLTVAATSVLVELSNFSKERALADTISWTVPESWTVTPAKMFVEVPAGETGQFEFTVKCDGDVYPLPELTVDFPYKEEGTCPASRELRVARRAECVLAHKPPVIDGVIDEDAWQAKCTGLLDDEGKPASVDSTEFFFAYDPGNLYLAVRCFEKHMDSVRALLMGPDAPVYTEDCAGFLYRPVASEQAIYQFYASPAGAVFDQKIVRQSDGYWVGDQSWNGKYEVAVGKEEGAWLIEVRIPLDQFGTRAEAGQEWDFYFRRKQWRLHASGNWQIPFSYDPNNHGKLVLQ